MPQFGLANQETLKQCVIPELEVRQHAQLFDGLKIQVLRLVDDQQGPFVLGDEQRQECLDRSDQFRFGQILGSDPERDGDRAQQVAGLELRADDLGRHDLLVVELGQHRPHQRGLAGADFPRHNDETLALVDPEPQVRQRIAVPLALEVELGIRVEVERRSGEAEVRFVHECW